MFEQVTTDNLLSHQLICPHGTAFDRQKYPAKTTFQLTSASIVDADQQTINLRSLAPTIENAPDCYSRKGYWSFFYGNIRTQEASELIHNTATVMRVRGDVQRQFWYSHLWYHMPQFPNIFGPPKTLDDAAATEYLIVDKLDQDSQRTLLNRAQQLLQVRGAIRHLPTGEARVWTQEGIGLEKLLARWPTLVWSLLDTMPEVWMLLHRTRLKVGEYSCEVDIATVRSDPRRILRINVHADMQGRLILAS